MEMNEAGRAAGDTRVRRRSLLAALPAVLLAGCATPYAPFGPLGGYSEAEVAPNVFRIEAFGNGFTSRERVQAMAVYRAAELAAARGFQRILIGDPRLTSAGVPNMQTIRRETITAHGGRAVAHRTAILVRFVNPGDPDFASGMEIGRVAAQLAPLARG
ncbi:MAG: hypothetical protein K2X11_08660 [Acetobacteraceae bacterium]|nr:hypothetical protein [Acetobacteraceae bacterium]